MDPHVDKNVFPLN